jgi:hypothetical protein
MESCDECAFSYSSIPENEIGAVLRHYGNQVVDWLSLGDDGADEWEHALRQKPLPEVWSVIEYAGHLALVLEVQHDRVQRALVETTPDFVPTGMDARIVADRVNERPAATVRSEFGEQLVRLASAFDSLDAARLSRTGIYNWPVRAERTLAWVGRHTIHELRHHLGDIGRGIAEAAPFGPNLAASERASLLSWLEHHRATLVHKCAGAIDEHMRARPVSTSTLSLVGLVRHMTCVEQYWFEEVLAGRNVVDVYITEADPDGDFNDADTADVGDAWALWQAQCATSRLLTSDAKSMEEVAVGLRRGSPVNLRWIVTHMIEEYARHNGHADLLREMVDGVTDN